MKICIIAYKFGTESEIGEHLGTYHWFIEFCRRLVKAGYEVQVLAPNLNFKNKGSLKIDGVKIVRYFPTFWYRTLAWPINKIWRVFYISRTKNIAQKLIKNYQPDTVLVWQSRETGFAISQIRNKFPNISFLFRQIGPWGWHLNQSAQEIYAKRSWYKILKKFGLQKLANKILEFLLDKASHKKYAQEIYKNFDKIILGSQISVNEAVENGCPLNKAVIQPVTIETELFKPLNQKSELRQELNIKGKKVLLFIGRINFAEKGIGYLLDAVKIASQKLPGLNLVIIGGGGEEERMLKKIKDLNLEKYTQHVGRKPFSELVKYINASDVFMMPSVWLETFGQVTIEAMACGVPVIYFNAGASPEINIDGQTGIMVETKNALAMADAIIKIFSDNERQQHMGANARQRVIENYSYQSLIKMYIELVNKLKT